MYRRLVGKALNATANESISDWHFISYMLSLIKHHLKPVTNIFKLHFLTFKQSNCFTLCVSQLRWLIIMISRKPHNSTRALKQIYCCVVLVQLRAIKCQLQPRILLSLDFSAKHLQATVWFHSCEMLQTDSFLVIQVLVFHQNINQINGRRTFSQTILSDFGWIPIA